MKGTTQVDFDTDDCEKKKIKMRRSDEVDKTIIATSELCDSGNVVVYSKSGGAIISDPGEKPAKQMINGAAKRTLFRRDRGTYSLDMWLKVPRQANREKREAAKAKKEAEKGQQEVREARTDKGDDDVMQLQAVPAEAWKTFRRSIGKGFQRPRP